MHADVVYQILVFILAAGFIILWVRNMASIGVSGDKFYTPTEGVLLAGLRLLLLDGSLACILIYCFDPGLMAWSALPLPLWLRWCGFFIGLAALIGFYWVIQALGHNFSTTLTIKNDQTLVREGPYHWVRHPMYTSFVLLWVGFFLVSGNWFIGLSGISGFALTMIFRTPKEEQMMIERFGGEYVAYMNATGRYLPRWLGKKTPQD